MTGALDRVRHLISISDLSGDELRHLADSGAEIAAGRPPAGRPLDGRIVGIYFRRTSTRTRTAFTAGALRLGAQTIAYGPHDLQLNTGETSGDTGRVLSGMLDALVVRTADQPQELRAFAGQDRMPVINAMSADEHPTQAIADLVTLRERFGRVENLRILYVGEGNNTAAALALALTRFPGVELELRTPPGYGLGQQLRLRSQKQAGRSGGSCVERHDMSGLPGGFDVIYTTRWQTTGTTKPDQDWRAIFAPFRVSRQLWQTSPGALFMHDLPAHRGDEVDADVLDGPASIAFRQAENKLNSAMAILAWCLARPGSSP